MLAKSLQAAAGNAAEAVYIEDVFSTYLYTGNGSTQTITNGIDLAGEGGMTWIKWRSTGYSFSSHRLYDTVRGATKAIASDLSDAETTRSGGLTAFNSNGFSLGNFANENGSTGNYASWTFRKAEKFFDVVTGTTNASGGVTFSHSLGSAPGCIIVKATGTTANLGVWHRSIPNGSVYLNLTNAQDTSDIRVSSATSTSVTITNTFWLPANQPFVAYLFAHNAGGFGDDGEQNVISCGSYTGTGAAGNFIDLGFEPQWVLIKRAVGGTGDWRIIDNMRGLVTSTTNGDATLNANTSEAEFNDSTVGNYPFAAANPTGFTIEATSTPSNASGSTYIYIAIRRGPMKTPEAGTEVFDTEVTAGSYPRTTLSGFPVDMTFAKSGSWYWFDRLRGAGKYIRSNSSGAEASTGGDPFFDVQDGILEKGGGGAFFNAGDRFWNFRRAPGFMDVVCYTGTGSARTVNHNLGVAPELMFIKSRSNSTGWLAYSATLGPTYWGNLNSNEQFYTPATVYLNNTAPASTVFTVGTSDATNYSAYTYVAYLFATVEGVSKVGSYTGTGTTQQINCGFSSGARFVRIKRTDSTGDWYVWDSARGIVAGNDPYLLLNSTAAEVTSTDYIDTYSAGFEISSTAPAAINANGGSFIFLAIA